MYTSSLKVNYFLSTGIFVMDLISLGINMLFFPILGLLCTYLFCCNYGYDIYVCFVNFLIKILY